MKVTNYLKGGIRMHVVIYRDLNCKSKIMKETIELWSDNGSILRDKRWLLEGPFLSLRLRIKAKMMKRKQEARARTQIIINSWL